MAGNVHDNANVIVAEGQAEMPTYEYKCKTCGHQFERVQRFTDAPITECPECGAEVRKVIHPAGVIFKGAGWYITDNRKSSGDAASANGTKAEGDTAKADAPKGGETKSGESKGGGEGKSGDAAKSGETTKSDSAPAAKPAATKVEA